MAPARLSPFVPSLSRFRSEYFTRQLRVRAASALDLASAPSVLEGWAGSRVSRAAGSSSKLDWSCFKLGVFELQPPPILSQAPVLELSARELRFCPSWIEVKAQQDSTFELVTSCLEDDTSRYDVRWRCSRHGLPRSGLDAKRKKLKGALAKGAGRRIHSLERFGPVRAVEPVRVFELAFEGIAASPRHKSGVAVRFSRILRCRTDKTAAQADTIESLKELLNAR